MINNYEKHGYGINDGIPRSLHKAGWIVIWLCFIQNHTKGFKYHWNRKAIKMTALLVTGMLKASFNIPSDNQGSHPNDLFISVTCIKTDKATKLDFHDVLLISFRSVLPDNLKSVVIP